MAQRLNASLASVVDCRNNAPADRDNSDYDGLRKRTELNASNASAYRLLDIGLLGTYLRRRRTTPPPSIHSEFCYADTQKRNGGKENV